MRLTIRPNLNRRGYRTVKRLFDLIASGAALVVLCIPGAILCAAICIKSPGASPIYTQYRVGRLNKDGTFRIFKMHKFRSMVPNAHAMVKQLQQENQADGPLFKIKRDPRIIPGLGNFIRAHSIDEIPQLWDVFIGNMALIGPRPALPKEVLSYDEEDIERLRVKPGCGGLWQATSRSNSTFKEMTDLDAEYIKNSGLLYDFKLMFKTIKSIFTGDGAC
ncbi:sugar transferase [Bifidobacterium sp. BRDM6]|uniref:Sugar transferase n=2 Tax=Bifidobacterium choloepi TaxID=2614131 RepID=A0A6I5NIY2_9BIFI|nr:sugar transferase [Bifidobacterium choloepi]